MNIAEQVKKASNVHVYVYGQCEWVEFVYNTVRVCACRYWFTSSAKTPWFICSGADILPGNKFQRGKICGAVFALPVIREERGPRPEFYTLRRGERPALSRVSATVAGRVAIVSFWYKGEKISAGRYRYSGGAGEAGCKYTPWIIAEGKTLPGTSRQQGCILSRAFRDAVSAGSMVAFGDKEVYTLSASSGAVPLSAVAAPAV